MSRRSELLQKLESFANNGEVSVKAKDVYDLFNLPLDFLSSDQRKKLWEKIKKRFQGSGLRLASDVFDSDRAWFFQLFCLEKDQFTDEMRSDLLPMIIGGLLTELSVIYSIEIYKLFNLELAQFNENMRQELWGAIKGRLSALVGGLKVTSWAFLLSLPEDKLTKERAEKLFEEIKGRLLQLDQEGFFDAVRTLFSKIPAARHCSNKLLEVVKDKLSGLNLDSGLLNQVGKLFTLSADKFTAGMRVDLLGVVLKSFSGLGKNVKRSLSSEVAGLLFSQVNELTLDNRDQLREVIKEQLSEADQLALFEAVRKLYISKPLNLGELWGVIKEGVLALAKTSPDEVVPLYFWSIDRFTVAMRLDLLAELDWSELSGVGKEKLSKEAVSLFFLPAAQFTKEMREKLVNYLSANSTGAKWVAEAMMVRLINVLLRPKDCPQLPGTEEVSWALRKFVDLKKWSQLTLFFERVNGTNIVLKKEDINRALKEAAQCGDARLLGRICNLDEKNRPSIAGIRAVLDDSELELTDDAKMHLKQVLGYLEEVGENVKVSNQRNTMFASAVPPGASGEEISIQGLKDAYDEAGGGRFGKREIFDGVSTSEQVILRLQARMRRKITGKKVDWDKGATYVVLKQFNRLPKEAETAQVPRARSWNPFA